MLSIRFSRVGKKKKPIYRIVVSEKSRDPWGKQTEFLGWYNPHTKEKELKTDRIEHWLSVGAQPSDSVHNLLVSEGIVKGDKRNVVTISKKRQAKMDEKSTAAEEAKKEAEAKAAEAEAAEAPAEETPAEDAAPAENAAPAEEVKEEAAEKPAAETEAPAEEAPETEAAPEEAPAEETKEETAEANEEAPAEESAETSEEAPEEKSEESEA